MYWLALALLVALTVADAVLAVVLFDLFDERLALFVNQGTAFVYILLSLAILAFRRSRQTAARRDASIALLDGEGNLVGPLAQEQKRHGQRAAPCRGAAPRPQAIAQPHTPGLVQTLLTLLGIPLVLCLAWAFLRRTPSLLAAAGALLIIGGAATSSLRSLIDPHADASAGGPVTVYSYSILIFGGAQVFAAVEKVYEESLFRACARLHPMVMFCWTLCTQFALGWMLYPLQTLPQFGNLSLAELPAVVHDGVLCTAARGGCGADHAIIFWSYCAVDFWCYYFGLWVIQHCGASLMVLASAIALPLQQLVLCSPMVGRWSESFFWGDGLALALVLVGFCVYQAFSPEGREARLANQS
ncbi:hypothetical protein AB1Y20_009647 [Prymnesium parvum]|uniref:Uncharacterized protein n=1 Tax=Prymnesium parvum TaxID=97485 RepID=A0AB34K2M6_PRYPA